MIFDSDPDGEEPMWVCPWEIELAPEEYQPKDEDYRPFGAAGGGGGAEEERSQADQAKVDAGQAIAERLGWPQGTAAARAEFNTWRQAANPDGTLPRSAPVFCRAELDLYRVLVEVMCLGGYELVTEEKRWKQVARTLGKDLTTQTSASFALRNNYQRYLLEFEMWLWDNADTLPTQAGGVQPAHPSRHAGQAAPHLHRARATRDGHDGRGGRGGRGTRLAGG